MTDRTHIPLQEKLDTLRQKASKGGLPTRRKDATLYSILSECFSLCQEVARDDLRDDLVAAIKSRPMSGRNRIYVYPKSDVHILVCRYVLEGEDNRNSIYRYAAALREAAKRQLSPEALTNEMAQNGGINRLFKSRPLAKRDWSTSTLHLNRKVAAPKDKAFTLTLQRDERGYFDILGDVVIA